MMLYNLTRLNSSFGKLKGATRKMSVIDEIKNKAKANKKTVVLPETTDMRTLTAAAEVISEGIADIILVGKKKRLRQKQKQKD